MNDNELHQAAEQGNRKRVQSLLDSGAAINAYDERGYTPLLRAVASKKTDAGFIRFLLKNGADHRLTARVSYGSWYMHHGLSLALASGDIDKVRVFLNAGADIRYVRKGGMDAMIDAASSASGAPGHGEAQPETPLKSLLEFLLSNGVPLSGRTEKGQTALMILSDRIAFDAARQLVRAGADETQLKWTPLHKAVTYGTASDVAARLEKGDPVDPKDHADRTPLVLAVQKGEIEKARLLWMRGADRNAKWRGKFSLLDLAITRKQPELVEWLAASGADVNAEDEYGFTPLTRAVMAGAPRLVKVLLSAGADIHKEGKHGANALKEARDSQMIQLLLTAGADTGMLSNEGRRVLVGLPPDPDISLLTAAQDQYSQAKHPREGRGNPEEVHEPFWLAMIRSGVNAYQAKTKYGDKSAPIWCAHRFGQSLTFLPDGRIILIGGEHEDSYDDDFHIYNDVFVFEPRGRLRISIYPENEFQPTDGHSATLFGHSIYIIGNVGYQGSRQEGFTPVYRLDTRTMRIEEVATSGEGPGWIGRHRAKLKGSQIEVAGGEIYRARLGKGSFKKNSRSFLLDLRAMTWHREL